MPFLSAYTVDPFVDDSDEIAQVNAELRKRKLKTVHGGFFVSSGELEVEKGPEMGRRKQATEDGLQRVSVVRSLPEAAQAAAPLIPSELDNDQKVGGQQQTPVLTRPVGVAPEQQSSATPRVRILKPKPLWNPCPATIAAIDVFRSAVKKLNVSLSKAGYIPQQVNEQCGRVTRYE